MTMTISNLLLWVAVIFLSGVVLLLLRQVGQLHERLGPVGALTLPGGVKVGEAAPIQDLVTLDSRPLRIGEPTARSTLLFFLSPTCSICKSLLPVIKSMAGNEADRLRIVLASDGDEALQRRLVVEYGLEAFSFVLSTDLGMTYGVSKLPYAALLGPDGRLAAKGLVNNREHLESLLEAEERGVTSLQAYLSLKRGT
jgi:methylamine dehydrogenase accessory protein MauD